MKRKCTIIIESDGGNQGHVHIDFTPPATDVPHGWDDSPVGKVVQDFIEAISEATGHRQHGLKYSGKLSKSVAFAAENWGGPIKYTCENCGAIVAEVAPNNENIVVTCENCETVLEWCGDCFISVG